MPMNHRRRVYCPACAAVHRLGNGICIPSRPGSNQEKSSARAT